MTNRARGLVACLLVAGCADGSMSPPSASSNGGDAAARCGADGLGLASASGGLRVGVVGVGRREVEGIEPSSPRRDGDLVARRIGEGVEEWWRPVPTGIEHGVTIAERPAGEGDLRLEVDFEGLEATVTSDGTAELRHLGTTVGSYAGLVAIDATGRELPTRMTAASGGLHLVVVDQGARYPVVVDPILVTEETRFDAPDWTSNFAWSVAIASDGTRATIGSPFESVGGRTSGVVHVMSRTGTSWTEEASLSRTSGNTDTDSFGMAVAITGSGDRVVVGVPGDFSTVPGHARVFHRAGTAWALESVLSAAGAINGAWAGYSVGLSRDGSRAIVGVPSDRSFGPSTGSGSARVFFRAGTTWAQEGMLVRSPEADVLTGRSVALSGDGTRAFVGCSDARVIVYSRDGIIWTQETILGPRMADGEGRTIATTDDGSRLVLGTPLNPFVGVWAGGARVFARSGTTWVEEAALTHPAGAGDDWFGASVAIDDWGARIVVGAPRDDTAAGADAGSAHLFVRAGSTWTWDGTLGSPPAMSRLGSAAALSADGVRAVVGALAEPVAGMGRGTARVLRLAAARGAPCSDDLGCASGFCTDGVCCDVRCGGGATDCEACSVGSGGSIDGTCGALSTGVAASVVCRAASDGCDAVEYCDASSRTCPADQPSSAGTTCRPTAGGCDVAEVCDGATRSCPLDARAAAGVECRASGGACDRTETCDGSTAACPPEGNRLAAGTPCRSATGPCDSAEVCDGSSPVCPGDVFEPAGSVCGVGMGDCATPGTCTGSSAACSSTGVRAAGTLCRAATSECDLADRCDGVSAMCPDSFATTTTPCGGASAGGCDAPDHCAGTSADCVAEVLAGVECRPPAGPCDEAEICVGDSPECPADGVAAAGLTCRASTDPSCDVAEVCDGVAISCPTNLSSCPDASGADASRGDGGPSVDAGAPANAAAGCGCRTGASAPSTPVTSALLTLGFVLVVRWRARG